jgi:Transposase DDE domain
MSQGARGSLQRELDSFFGRAAGEEFNMRYVTKGAYSQARQKINPEAFLELNQRALETFYEQAPWLRWKKRPLRAVDGSRLKLPNHKSVKQEFGTHKFGPKAESEQSLAITSVLFDPLNLIMLDAKIAPYASSERKLLNDHFDKLNAGDILLLDRGYPSLALFFLLKAKGIDFCIRMKEDWWTEVKKFNESGENERIVKFSLPKKDQKALKDYPEMISTEIECKLVSFTLESGEKEILCTSLTDAETYPYEDFFELYHLRWGIEECYKLFKLKAEVENFSGKTSIAVKQDFYAKMFLMTLTAILAFPMDEKIIKESQENPDIKHVHKMNRTSALSLTSKMMLNFFLKKNTKEAIEVFDRIMYKTKEIVRPGRKNERKKQRSRSYPQNHKPI